LPPKRDGTIGVVGELVNSRWIVSWPLFALGAVGVISGGLVAAAIAPDPTEHGSWAAAYLVLVVGVAQIALSAGQAVLSVTARSAGVVAVEAACWNVANALVIAGTVADVHAIVYAGGALLVVALAIFANGARGATTVAHARRWSVYAFRALVVLLLVSIPVGLVLATVRNGA
jgi:hypothetical protein